MAKPQVSVGFWKRLWGWSKRHKIWAGLSLVVVLLVLIVLEGWIQTSISIHFERERFMKTSQTIRIIGRQISTLQASTDTSRDDCSYTTFGGVFAEYSLGCESSSDVVFTNIAQTNAQKLVVSTEKILKKHGITFKENKAGASKYDIKIDVFDLNGLGCALSATYYDTSIPASDRYTGHLLLSGEGLVLELNCSAPAQAEYFPVTDS